MTKGLCSYTRIGLGLVWMLLMMSTSVFADERLYRLELGIQAGGSYYAGELAPYAFLSMGETYGMQVRCKIDNRWALQFKGQRQRVINTLEAGNQWGLPAGAYQNPMWHFDLMGEFNFFRFGYQSNDYRVRNITPFISVGIGFTAYNVYATRQEEYPMVEVNKESRMNYALYLPVCVGMKWEFAPRWQLQVAWQHQLYMANGDGIEGVIDYRDPGRFNDSYGMNGSNVMNNDVTSTITVGVVFEFAREKNICVQCR